MKQTLLATLSVATVFCSSTVFANPTMSNQGIYLDPSATARYVKTIRNQLLEIGVDPEVSEFKIPATTKISYRCIPGGMGVICFKIEQVVEKSCPTTIPVKWPDGTYKDVAVNCVGPDAQGNCECELR